MELWELLARESARHTMAMYNHAGDRGRIDELAACFTEDGALHIGDEAPHVGRTSILERLSAVLPTERRPTHVHHHVSSVRFPSVAPDRITAASYFVVLTDVGTDHWGRYQDELVPVGDRWLFSRRMARTSGFASGSFFAR